jgi:hypothetical protein
MKVIVPFIITNLLVRSGPKNLVAPRCFKKLLFINQVFVPLIEQPQVLLSLPWPHYKPYDMYTLQIWTCSHAHYI